MSHSMRVCEYGITHSQCRCPSPNKTVVEIVCDIPSHNPDSLLNKVIHTPEPVNKPWHEIIDEFLEPSGIERTLDKVLVDELWWMQEPLRIQLRKKILNALN